MSGISGTIGIPEATTVEKMVSAFQLRATKRWSLGTQRKIHIAQATPSITRADSDPETVCVATAQLSLVFTGEIFNHGELRADLAKKGHLFAGKSDTEVILHLYEDYGSDCVDHLDGMFAFAIVDGDRVILARDRLGIKPLYYVFLPEADIFVFASEIKALLQCHELSPRLDLRAFVDWILLGHLVGTETFFEGVKSLAAGHTMVVSCANGIVIERPKSYFTPAFVRDSSLGVVEAEHALEQTIRAAVASQIAGVKNPGIAISGLDSTMLAFIARDIHESPLMTFTVSDNFHHPDMAGAARIAEIIGAKHRSVVLSFDQYLRAVPTFIAAVEQPSSLAILPFYALCHDITDWVRICLVGEGADTLLGGSFQYLHRTYGSVNPIARLPWLKRVGALPSDCAISIIERLSSAVAFDEYLERAFEVNVSHTLQHQALALLDKCATSANVELRFPFLDDRVFQLASHLPVHYLVRTDLGIAKYLLKRLCLKRFGTNMVDAVLREKVGIPGAASHLVEQLDQLCNELLPDSYLTQLDIGCCFDTKRKLVMFELFLEIFMKNRGETANVGSLRDFMLASAGRPNRAEAFLPS